MKRNIIYYIGVVCMMTSCLRGIDTPNPLKGNDVSFSATLGGTQTKTLYDDSFWANNIDGSVKVNWVHNDLITIFGAECTAVPQAEYRVATVEVDENGNETPVSGQNSASYLTKTGAAGVQWGEKSESDFYAVYPSTGDNEFAKTDNGATVVAHIRPVQKNVFKYNEDRKCWEGRPYVQDVNNPTMQDAVMYAKTTANAENTVVNLSFKPWSTVLKFRFGGFSYTTNVGVQQGTVSVRSITLQAPPSVKAIAGDFDLTIDKNGNATSIPRGDERSITIQPDYLPLSSGQAVEFSVFTIPYDDKEGNNDYYFGADDDHLWKVKIETTSGTSFTYKMRPSNGSSTAYIAPGKIHKVSIPSREIDKVGDLTGSEPNWMEKIPRNVYLSELSLPGSWYCTESVYSGTEDLDALYNGGVRAFHINCCVYNNELRCAGSDGSVRDVKVADKLLELNKLASQHSKEYIAVVLSIAEEGGTVDPATVLPKIDDMLASTSLTNLYRKAITPNTTVADVTGHMIVLVNANSNLPNANWFNGDALIAEASLALSNSGNIIAGSFKSMQESDLYWGSNSTSLKYYYHHAQGTSSDGGDHPSFANRREAIRDIISESDDIYLASSHDGWFMMGIGGYLIYIDNWFGDILGMIGGWIGLGENVFGSTTDVASNLNNYVLGLIENKLNKVEGFYPSPVGIVLMNYPLNSQYYGPELVKAIMNMNAAFLLESDPDRDAGTGESILDIEAGYADVTSWEDVYLN